MILLRRHRRTVWLIVTVILLVGFTSIFGQHENTPPGDTESKRERMYNNQHNSILGSCNEIKSKSRQPGECDSLSAIAKRRSPKVYIYTLPDKFNLDIQNCRNSHKDECINLKNGGFGDLLYKVGELAVFSTNHFSLEVIIHNQLLLSKYRTEKHEEADIFYIPAYMGMRFHCGLDVDVNKLVSEMFSVVNSMPYFRQGRPHLSTLAMIEREMGHDFFPVLRNPMYRNVTNIVIEKEPDDSLRNFMGLVKQRVIVAPYPSYVHLDRKLAVSQTISAPSLESRVVFMLLAASDRRTNSFRNTIVDQISHTVRDIRFSDYIKITDIPRSGPHQVWLNTGECLKAHENITIEWMQNSVFCLQPHGDSPTRKSFYDSILSGCIPVIFKFHKEKVLYPFQRVLNYSDFVVSIDGSRVERNDELVINILKDIPQSEIVRLHHNVLRVARQLQYSFVDENSQDTPYVDALDMIINEVMDIYSL